mmetsp:Transcript_123960/g.246812  ORF Transcript_123960/g.246812 Transcript_123960/m.246812 type:complete len:292 (+) Transcript_123960:1472-2347(+)
MSLPSPPERLDARLLHQACGNPRHGESEPLRHVIKQGLLDGGQVAQAVDAMNQNKFLGLEELNQSAGCNGHVPDGVETEVEAGGVRVLGELHPRSHQGSCPHVGKLLQQRSHHELGSAVDLELEFLLVLNFPQQFIDNSPWGQWGGVCGTWAMQRGLWPPAMNRGCCARSVPRGLRRQVHLHEGVADLRRKLQSVRLPTHCSVDRAKRLCEGHGIPSRVRCHSSTARPAEVRHWHSLTVVASTGERTTEVFRLVPSFRCPTSTGSLFGTPAPFTRGFTTCSFAKELPPCIE